MYRGVVPDKTAAYSSPLRCVSVSRIHEPGSKNSFDYLCILAWLFIFLPFYLSDICRSIDNSMPLCIHSSVYLSIYPSLYSSVHFSISPSIHLSIHLSLSIDTSLYMYRYTYITISVKYYKFNLFLHPGSLMSYRLYFNAKSSFHCC